MCSHTFTCSPPWLCSRGCLLISLHQSIRWAWVYREKHRTSAAFGALGGGHLSCSALVVVLVHSLPCRPCGHMGELQTSGCTREFGNALFTAVYPHYISLMFVSSVAIEPWSCVWVHSFLLFFSRG